VSHSLKYNCQAFDVNRQLPSAMKTSFRLWQEQSPVRANAFASRQGSRFRCGFGVKMTGRAGVAVAQKPTEAVKVSEGD
jgi:hypothetical protein